MKRSTLLIAVIISVLFPLLNGCKSEAGPAGPPGNANVRSVVFTVASSDWVEEEPGFIFYDKSMAGLTQGIADSGVVLLYAKYTDFWLSLPRGFNGSGGVTVIDYAHKSGMLEIVAYSNTLSTAQIKIDRMFKLIVVESSGPLAKVNVKNYEEVKKALHLEE